MHCHKNNAFIPLDLDETILNTHRSIGLVLEAITMQLGQF